MPEYTIRGITVKFPYNAYECQKVYMERVIQALQTGTALHHMSSLACTICTSISKCICFHISVPLFCVLYRVASQDRMLCWRAPPARARLCACCAQPWHGENTKWRSMLFLSRRALVYVPQSVEFCGGVRVPWLQFQDAIAASSTDRLVLIGSSAGLDHCALHTLPCTACILSVMIILPHSDLLMLGVMSSQHWLSWHRVSRTTTT